MIENKRVHSRERKTCGGNIQTESFFGRPTDRGARAGTATRARVCTTGRTFSFPISCFLAGRESISDSRLRLLLELLKYEETFMGDQADIRKNEAEEADETMIPTAL